eukprot:XP_025981841.1 nitrogen regulatory protein P-II homolog [Glycine max]
MLILNFSFLDSKVLLKMGIRGVTVSDVRGFGAQGGSKERQGSSEFPEDNFVAKVKMEVVVRKDQQRTILGGHGQPMQLRQHAFTCHRLALF